MRKNYALKKKIRILKSLDDVLTLKKVDIIISVQFHKILNKFHIYHFTGWWVLYGIVGP